MCLQRIAKEIWEQKTSESFKEYFAAEYQDYKEESSTTVARTFKANQIL